MPSVGKLSKKGTSNAIGILVSLESLRGKLSLNPTRCPMHIRGVGHKCVGAFERKILRVPQYVTATDGKIWENGGGGRGSPEEEFARNHRKKTDT